MHIAMEYETLSDMGTMMMIVDDRPLSLISMYAYCNKSKVHGQWTAITTNIWEIPTHLRNLIDMLIYAIHKLTMLLYSFMQYTFGSDPIQIQKAFTIHIHYYMMSNNCNTISTVSSSEQVNRKSLKYINTINNQPYNLYKRILLYC